MKLILNACSEFGFLEHRRPACAASRELLLQSELLPWNRLLPLRPRRLIFHDHLSQSLFTMKTLMLLVALLGLLALAGCVEARQHRTPTKPPTPVEYLPVRLALNQRNVDVLEETLYAVSSPQSPIYGQHLTQGQIATLIGLTHEEIKEVKAFVQKELRAKRGSVRVHNTRDYVDAEIPADLAHEIVGDAGQRQRKGERSSSIRGRFASHPTVQQHIQFALFRTQKVLDSIRAVEDSKSKYAHLKKLPTRRERRMAAAKKHAQQQVAKKIKGKRAPKPNDLPGTPANQLAAYGVPAGTVATNTSHSQMVWSVKSGSAPVV